MGLFLHPAEPDDRPEEPCAQRHGAQTVGSAAARPMAVARWAHAGRQTLTGVDTWAG
jgi:hypothetical protein